MSAPQVGPLTALVVRAEIGDIRRFRSPKSLVRYIGLAPRVHERDQWEA